MIVWSEALYKVRALFVAFWLCGISSITHAEPATEQPGPLHPILHQLSTRCDALLPDLDPAALERLLEFYGQQDFQRVWHSYEQIDSLLLQLEQLADDGLDPRTYQADTIRRLMHAATPDPLHLDCSDIFTTQRYLAALRHLAEGRLAQAQLEPVWRSSELPVEAHQQRLLRIATAGLDDLPGAFEQARPDLAQYRNLRSAYAQRRNAPLPEWTPFPGGPTLRPGMSDPRVPLLRQRLQNDGFLQVDAAQHTDPGVAETAEAAAVQAASENLDRYQPPLVEALKAFQTHHALQADGILGADTASALNISPASRLDQLRINLERFRWLSRDIEARSLLVDIAGGRVTYLRDFQPQWQARTQVGKAARQTPDLKSQINRLTLNPTWTVPPTILREDKLPAIRRDLDYLAEHRLQVLDYQGNVLDPQTIDWNNPRGFMLRQAAGPQNPLGKVAIRFANPFAVYLHDTPSQQLFQKSPRAFSSGCVRVETVMQLLDMLTSDAEHKRMLSQLASGKTREFRLAEPTPILMAYWTAEADASGEPEFRPDIYARDPALLAALNAAR